MPEWMMVIPVTVLWLTAANAGHPNRFESAFQDRVRVAVHARDSRVSQDVRANGYEKRAA